MLFKQEVFVTYSSAEVGKIEKVLDENHIKNWTKTAGESFG